MANDIGWMSGIVIFWIVLTILLTNFANDHTFGQNQTFDFNSNVDVGSFNDTNSEAHASANPYQYLSMWYRIFLFRVPSLPTPLNVMITLFNWFLGIVFGLLVYRQVRSGAG